MVFLRSAVFSAARRIPLIRFRKGGLDIQPTSAQHPVSGSGVSGKPRRSSPRVISSKSGQSIEDWELPPRYRRKGIDPVEMAYINTGGPPV